MHEETTVPNGAKYARQNQRTFISPPQRFLFHGK